MSVKLIFLFLNMNNLSHFRQKYSKTIFEYKFSGHYLKILKNNFWIRLFGHFRGDYSKIVITFHIPLLFI